MENAEEVMQILERFTRLKQKEIPKELDDYLQYVAKTGETVFNWTSLKYLFREKLLNVISHFHDTTPRIDEIPQYPNVDPFNYESMKSSLLERLESFNAAPFTIQRLSELLIDPRKQYNRIDKFMRALEKNILVSTVEPGRKRTESENGDSLDSVVNGDLSLDVNVDIDMENEPLFKMEAQNGNGNGNDASPTETNNEVAESKPEEEDKVNSTKVSPIHKLNDDEFDSQPSPKKAKLDVIEDKENVESSTTTIETAKTTEIIVETEKVKETKEEVDTTNNETKVEEKKEKSEIENDVEKKMENVDETKIAEKVTKGEGEDEVKTVTLPKKEFESNVSSTVSKTVDDAANVTTITAAAVTTVIAESNLDKVKDVANVVEVTDNKDIEEKIIEKQEIEKCEKEIKTTKEEDKVEKESVEAEAVPVVEPNTALTKAQTVIETKAASSTEEQQASIDSTEVPTTTEKEKVDATKNTAAHNESPKKIVENLKSSPKTKENVAEAETEKVVVEQKVDEAKIETEADSTVAAQKTDEKEEIKVAKIETTAEVDVAIEAVKAALKPETIETAVITSTEDVKTDEAVGVAITTAVTAETVAEAEAVAVTVSPVVNIPVMPTLALNDQPMEEDAATSSVVDEVVMAESTASSAIAGVDNTEMATDAMDEIATATKADEAGDGMDVDDTSQQEEAMDQ